MDFLNFLNNYISQIKPLNRDYLEIAQKKLDKLTKPKGSLGRLEELAKRIAVIKENTFPKIEKKVIFTFAGDHGVAKEGVSAYPKEVTPQMVNNFLQGGAAINVLSRFWNIKVIFADLGVDFSFAPHDELIDKKVAYGTNNFFVGPAMTYEEALKSISCGIEVFEKEFDKNGIDICGIGEMGIGNTTSSSAISSCILDIHPEKVTGRGTGIDNLNWKKKIDIISKSLKINNPDTTNPIDVLSKVGGFEIGGLVGVMLAASRNRVPVMIDGFIAAASALIACSFTSKVKDYLIASHCSVEPGHCLILEYLNLEPLFNLNMRLGEGTGAAIGINLAEASIKILNEMATFESAGVSEEETCEKIH